MRNNRKHKKTSGWWIGGLILLVGLGLVLGLGQVGAANASVTPMPKYLGQPVPANTPQYPPGIPAIQPHLITANTSGSGSSPAFTAADATQYVTSHPFWHTKILVSGPVKVTHVEFITSSALSVRLHDENIGRPDAALVCYVQIQGTIILPGVKGAHTVHTAFEVFDAQTGNLILSGD
jgi:hypothetical protein